MGKLRVVREKRRADVQVLIVLLDFAYSMQNHVDGSNLKSHCWSRQLCVHACHSYESLLLKRWEEQ
jgi:hypothetical protein